MKTFLLLFSSFKEVERLITLKEELIKYFGDRLIEDKMNGCPALILNRTIENVDRKYITALISSYNSGSIAIFIKEKNDSDNLSGQLVYDLTSSK